MGLRDGLDNSCKWRSLAAAGAIGMIAVFLQLAGAEGREALAWDRSALADGELWRLVTGHFAHLGWSHLGLNLAGLALVAWIAGEAYGLLRWAIITLATIAVIDAGFWYLYTDLEWYVGLSGLLHGLLVAGLLPGIRRHDRDALVLAMLVIGKLAWEQAVGPMPGSESGAGGAVIVDAHLYGAVGGLLGALLTWRRVGPDASI